MKTLPKPFWTWIDDTDGCWRWTGTVDRAGYGRVAGGQYESNYAHRLAYLALVGAIPEGLELDHLCRTRNCVNPKHLEPVTHTENMRRGHWARTQRCKWGHEFSGENLYIDPEGRRRCRLCRRIRQAALRARKSDRERKASA